MKWWVVKLVCKYTMYCRIKKNTMHLYTNTPKRRHSLHRIPFNISQYGEASLPCFAKISFVHIT